MDAAVTDPVRRAARGDVGAFAGLEALRGFKKLLPWLRGIVEHLPLAGSAGFV